MTSVCMLAPMCPTYKVKKNELKKIVCGFLLFHMHLLLRINTIREIKP